MSIIISNSTLAGGGVGDILLLNNSRLTLLNTTYVQGAQVTGTSQLKVQWYAAFEVLDRANNIIPGALVGGIGMNGSTILPVPSGIDGMVKDIVVTEFIQNATNAVPVFTYHTPYIFDVTTEGETNITSNLLVCGSFSSKIYFDFAPKIKTLSDVTMNEDRSFEYNLTPYLTDKDNPLDLVVLTVDRDYVTVDNPSHSLSINRTTPLEVDNVTVTASDGMMSSNRTFSIAVKPVNDAPICIQPILNQSVLEDQILAIDLTKYFWDEENGSRLNFKCNYKNLTIDNVNKTAIWSPKEGDVSLSGVIITANDGFLECDSNSFNINVILVNDAPVYIGDLNDTTVFEHNDWTIDLDDYFSDEEDAAGLRFECSCDEIRIDRLTHQAVWNPSGDTIYSIEVNFTARDSQNFSMSVDSETIKLTYVSVNDPPVYKGKLAEVHIKYGEEWNTTLEDLFADPDTTILIYSVNNPGVSIVEINKTTHRAVWKPRKTDINLTNVIFTAFDRDSKIDSTPINLNFDKPVEPKEKAPLTLFIEKIPWWVYILLPAGIIGGLAAFYSYRKVRYGKYEIEQLFLVYNDGRLIAHRQKRDIDQVSNELLTAMLTALKGFIKESLKDQNKGELDEMKYGDLKIAMEHGKNVYLAAFISGYVTDKLKAGMKDAVQKVEAKFEPVLMSWDGMMTSVEGVGPFLDELIGKPGS